MRFALFSDDVVIVTVEDFGGEDERNGVVYSRPLILHCAFSEGGRDTLSVKPIIPDLRRFREWIAASAARINERELAPGVRVRVRVLGRAAFDEKDALVDGFVPGAPRADGSIDLNFDAAGLGEPSDFESWVYLS
jgi:hypothetical protein